MDDESSSKVWANQKQARKYNSNRDTRKAIPNGAKLNRAETRGPWNDGHAQMESLGGIDPTNGILDLNHQSVQSNVSSLIENTNPTSITYERVNGQKTPSQKNNLDGYGDTWTVYYRYTPQQQQEAFQKKIQQRKEWKKHEKEYVKKHVIPSKQPAHSRVHPKNVYKPPDVQEQVLLYKKPRGRWNPSSFYDEQCKRLCVQYDLGRNQWITAFSTTFRYDQRWARGGDGCVCIGEYKLYVAVDEEERERRQFGIEEQRDQRNTGKVACHDSKRESKALSTRSKKKKERKRLQKEAKTKAFRDKMKWEYVGCFDGSMNGFHFNKSTFFSIEKIHRINHNVPFDYNNNQSMKKNFSKNGKLARWIKLVPCNDINARKLDKELRASIYGTHVDDCSRPLLSMDCNKKKDGGFNHSMNASFATNQSVIENKMIHHNEEKGRRKNFHVGQRVEDKEINEGKGCRLIITEKRPMKAFSRGKDGVRHPYKTFGWRNERHLWKMENTKKDIDDVVKDGISYI